MRTQTKLLLSLITKQVELIDLWLVNKEQREEIDTQLKVVCYEIIDRFGPKDPNKIENLTLEEAQGILWGV